MMRFFGAEKRLIIILTTPQQKCLPMFFLFLFLNFYEQIVCAKFHHTSQVKTFGFEKTSLIRKPYEKQCDTNEILTTPQYERDQTSAQCPLPLMSSSRDTGCLCDPATTQINCTFTNLLDKIPRFSQPSDDSPATIYWRIDLRCKNFTTLDDFTNFTNLTHIDLIDLAGSFHKNNCQTSFDLKTNNEITKLKQIGIFNFSAEFQQKHNHRPVLIKPTVTIHINHLNLNSNQINKFNLTLKTLKMPLLKYSLKIKNMSLDNNELHDEFDMHFNLDPCSFGVEHLNLANNKLQTIDIAFLIYLKHLNLSRNSINTFKIDFFNDAYPNKINCRNSPEFISVNADLASFNSRLKLLDLSFNNLNDLPFRYLTNVRFENLHSLNLSNNYLTTLNESEFFNLPNLKYLQLDSNQISYVHNLTFSNLNGLKYLDLSSNLIDDLPQRVFKPIHYSMEHLVLTQNRFHTIPKQALQHAYQVKYLYLNENRIKHLDNYSFGFMFKLLEIYLSDNLIDTIEVNAFMIDEGSLVGPGLVEKLDLSNNRLTHLNSTVFSYLTNLRYLMLNNNQLKLIEKSVFFGVNNLISLDLSLNHLVRLDFLNNKNFSMLRYLKLSNNEINTLRPGQFVCLKSLNNLDLSSNRIKRIADCAFYGLQKTIRKLMLNYNRITKINSCAFSLDFAHLRFVQLLKNPLNCTNNCEFFFTVYSRPYSIDYKGIECIETNMNNFSHCSYEHYEQIYEKCNRRLFGNYCMNTTRLSDANDCEALFDFDDFDTSQNGSSVGGKYVWDYEDYSVDSLNTNSAFVFKKRFSPNLLILLFFLFF